MKKKQEKEGKNRIRTLFEVGMKKAKDIPLLPTQPEASASKTRHPLSVPSPVIIHPSQLQAEKTKERQGCVLGWEIIDRLRLAAQRIESKVPSAEEGDEILTYAGRANAELHCAGVSNEDEIWEMINPGLDRLLGFGKTVDEIRSIIRGGLKGIDRFCEYLEFLIEEKGLNGGLIEGKVSALINAIGNGCVLCRIIHTINTDQELEWFAKPVVWT